MPKIYGTPSYQPPSRAASAGRPKVGPASPEEIHRRLDAYEAHLRQEHARIQHVRKVVPRGNTGGQMLSGSKTPPLRVEKALKDAGA